MRYEQRQIEQVFTWIVVVCGLAFMAGSLGAWVIAIGKVAEVLNSIAIKV